MRVYTTGVFDILHRGHLTLLTKARALGTELIVGVQADDSVEACKGRRPILSTSERVDQLKSLTFVSDVIVYDGVDQLPQYKTLKPDIVVQGDDWIHSADRTEMINFMKQENIRLVLFPYTKGISSSEIKRRINESEERKDREFILNHLQLVNFDDIRFYEEFDENKVEVLAKLIANEGRFINPVTVAKAEGMHILIDGNNRVEALRRLGITRAPALVVDYNKDVELKQNIFYTEGGKTTRLSEFRGTGEEWKCPRFTKEQVIDCIRKGKSIDSGLTWHQVNAAVIRLPMMLKWLKDEEFDFNRFLKSRIDTNQIRYYPRNVYICDEWSDELNPYV